MRLDRCEEKVNECSALKNKPTIAGTLHMHLSDSYTCIMIQAKKNTLVTIWRVVWTKAPLQLVVVPVTIPLLTTTNTSCKTESFCVKQWITTRATFLISVWVRAEKMNELKSKFIFTQLRINKKKSTCTCTSIRENLEIAVKSRTQWRVRFVWELLKMKFGTSTDCSLLCHVYTIQELI